MSALRTVVGAGLVIASACTVVSASQAQTVFVEQVPVSDAAIDPALDSLCHLHIKRKFLFFSVGEFTGTGVLYKGRYILTAGHNVYQDRSTIASIKVRCGTAEPMDVPVTEAIGGWQGLDASSYPRGGFARDFGVIRLSQTINVRAPFVLAEWVPKAGTAVRFAGFPGEGDQANASLRDGWHLHQAKGVATSNADSILSYNIRTYKSNSGGPVWTESDGQPSLVAIHVKPSSGRIVDTDFISEVNRLIGVLDRTAGTERR